MTNSKSVRTGLAAAALAMLLAASGHAWAYNHQNLLTFSRPVALPGVVLPAGSYSFDVASPTALDVVVVREARSGKPLYMGFTNTVERPRRMPTNTPIAFGEATANQPRPIAAWYELGATVGHEFLYR
ncbi:MAG TPA: hypothetical protein VEP46_12880 [Vicinamibacterales bacterium]|nr:hypothetical protein [Vicinamibacterales bacterium]